MFFPGGGLPARHGGLESGITTQVRQAPGGYWYPDQTITGFSVTHFSGRGVMYLMNVPFMPVMQPVTISPGTDWDQFAAAFSHTNETASPGHYQGQTRQQRIETELTGHAAHRHGAVCHFRRNRSATLLDPRREFGFHCQQRNYRLLHGQHRRRETPFYYLFRG